MFSINVFAWKSVDVAVENGEEVVVGMGVEVKEEVVHESTPNFA